MAVNGTGWITALYIIGWIKFYVKIIQGHLFICHLKASMRLPISDQ